MNNATLQPGETAIDTWTIFYTPPGGKKFNGKLTVTNKRLIYRTLYDAGYNPASYHVTFDKEDKDVIYSINKADIARTEVKKSLLSKKVIVTLADGTNHEFNYGAMSVDKLAAAIDS
ncbi:MAG: hypothetical protein JST09_07875 [Bacteroidetes bacterium]|nr:hypothetical protein [Bacteroidota bacterium]MBS1608962.1 hypothetical protein [Bacteroidota bacterium]